MRVVRRSAHDPMCVTATSRACLVLLLLLLVAFTEGKCTCSMNFSRTVYLWLIMECCFKGFDDIVSDLQLSSLCKDVCQESLIVQTMYKLLFDFDAGYVCFVSWTAKLTIHSKGTYSHEEVLYRFALTLLEITKVRLMNCWIHTFSDYFLNDFEHGRLIHLEECGVQIDKTVLYCVISGIVQMRSNL